MFYLRDIYINSAFLHSSSIFFSKWIVKRLYLIKVSKLQITNGNSNSYIKRYTLQIGEVEIYESYILAQLNEGITMNIEAVEKIIAIAKKHFPSQPFAYITIRKNSYAVDPMVYLKAFEIENFKAIAIVSDKFIDNHNVKIEKHFFNKPMNIFKTKEEAVTWAKTYL